MAVKEGLHTATFRAKAKKQKERRAKVTTVAKSKGEKPPPDRFRHMDAMSETDMSGAEDKVASKGKGKAKANGGPPAQEKKRSTKSFARKAAAAAFTFFISGCVLLLVDPADAVTVPRCAIRRQAAALTRSARVHEPHGL